MMRRRVRRRDGDPIGPRRFHVRRDVVGERRRFLSRAVAVERLKLSEIDALDVSADAALAEGQRHPRLKVRDDARGHFRMRRQEEVQTVGVSVHQLFQPFGTLLVLRLHVGGVDVQLHPKVPIHLTFAFGFREAAHGIEIVCLHAIEVVLGLRVHDAEDRVGIGLSVHVRYAPGVAKDGDVLRFLLPPGNLFVIGGAWGRRQAHHKEDEHELFHKSLNLWPRPRGATRADCVIEPRLCRTGIEVETALMRRHTRVAVRTTRCSMRDGKDVLSAGPHSWYGSCDVNGIHADELSA